MSKEASRIYTIPLGKAWLSPRKHRAKRAVNMIKEFAIRHMKVDDVTKVKIDEKLNKVIWEKGIEKPPRRVTVKMEKDEDGIIWVKLAD
jgi:large subunit ribosomal protein L31e